MNERLPLIGVTSYGFIKSNPFFVLGYYVNCIRRAGGIPLLIPTGEKHLSPLMDTFDGFVFTGGGDMDPGFYNGKPHENIYGIDKVRDESEIRLAKLVMEHQVPTLAICRGIQVFNVAMGGTLIEDILQQQNPTVIHRLPDFESSMHEVVLDPHCRLASLLGVKRLTGASRHHQALGEIPEGIKAVGVAADGIIEAIEHADLPSLIAVQWHPELTAHEDPIQQRLFDSLIENVMSNNR